MLVDLRSLLWVTLSLHVFDCFILFLFAWMDVNSVKSVGVSVTGFNVLP